MSAGNSSTWILPFIAGAASGALAIIIVGQRRKWQTIREAHTGDDHFQSLFYSKAIEAEGGGMPRCGTCDDATRARMTRIDDDFKFLPRNFYAQLCESTVICCVDVMLQRRSDKKVLLFLRRDAPAKGIWWWPGGRLFRGETFDVCAARKVKDETGGRYSAKALGVVQVWNTFFPDSSWDAGRSSERFGTQTVNVVLVCVTDDEPLDDEETSGQVASWAVESQRWVSREEVSCSGAFDKYVSENVLKAAQLGLLL